MSHIVHLGDCLAGMRALADQSVDAVVTDPPYELTQNKRGGSGAASPNVNSLAGRARIGTGGFMGKSWDATGIAHDVATWKEVLRVMKPGAHLVAFGGSRTYHRMACAIEDAGFEIRDSMQWIYGTGFPKSLSVEKQTGDRAHSGLGTALKPGYEIIVCAQKPADNAIALAQPGCQGGADSLPIVLARKPLIGTVAANVQAHGTGALNVDACRIGTEKRSCEPNGTSTNAAMIRVPQSRQGVRGESKAVVGRWPANVILDEEAGALLDEQSAPKMHGAGRARSAAEGTHAGAGSEIFGVIGGAAPRFGDTGGASRFFYCAKASKAEREAGLEAFPVKSAGELTVREDDTDGLESPRTGAGRGGGRANIHPTVKPVALMRWLCRLVTPPGGIVLDPFTGSGTTGVAAMTEGFQFVGFERDPDYHAIAEARIAAVREPQRAAQGVLL